MIETFKVKGMHCASCASAVERILKKQEGVQDASVNLLSEQVSITSDTYLQDIRVMQQALEKAGFELERIQESSEMTMDPQEAAQCHGCAGEPAQRAGARLLSGQSRCGALGRGGEQRRLSSRGKAATDDAGGPLSYRRHALRQLQQRMRAHIVTHGRRAGGEREPGQ